MSEAVGPSTMDKVSPESPFLAPGVLAPLERFGLLLKCSARTHCPHLLQLFRHLTRKLVIP